MPTPTPYKGFIEGSYQAISPVIDAERSMNLFVEVPPANAKAFPALIHRPGLATHWTLSTGFIPSALLTIYQVNTGAHTYAIGINNGTSAAELYEINDPGGTITPLGVLAHSSLTLYDQSSISASKTQVFVVGGVNAYIWTPLTSTFAALSSITWFQNADTAICVIEIDGYFVCLGALGTLGSSDLNDGFTWNPLNFSLINSSDPPVTIATDGHGLLWIFCVAHIEVWSDQAISPGFPFAPIAGARLQVGCAASLSVQSIDNTLFWVGADFNGFSGVYRANGFSPEKISTPAIDNLIETLASSADIADLESMAYYEKGHAFYQISIPFTGVCVVYDISTGQWHDRSHYTGPAGEGTFDQHLAVRHTYNPQLQMHIVAGFSSPSIYEQSMSLYSDDDNPLYRYRAGPVIWQNGLTLSFKQFLLDCEVGESDAATVSLAFSNDGGRTYSAEQVISTGPSGDFFVRVQWNQQGSTRRRCFRVTQTDNSPTFWTGAYLNVQEGVS